MIDSYSDGLFERLFIDHPFYEITPQALALEIESVVKNQKMDYLEATSYLCEHYEMDYNVIAKMLTPTMKDKIEIAAESRNQFKKSKPTIQQV